MQSLTEFLGPVDGVDVDTERILAEPVGIVRRLDRDGQNRRPALGAAKAPERLQVVDALPRRADGEVRQEILQLVAMNQIDLIEPLIKSEVDRAFLKDILESRKNLRDRFNFESSELNSQ